MSFDTLPEGETLVREIEGVGRLVFENLPAGAWLTQKGEPAKIPRRRYLVNDQELDAVSSIVDTLDKYALRRWIETQATIGAVQAERMGELADVHPDDYVFRVKALKLGASAARDEGADRGKAIHTAFHTLATTGRPTNPATLPGAWRPWLQGAMKAWLSLAPEMVASEEMVCHPELMYGGRPDLLAVVDGKKTLLDYKTGKGRVFDQAHYQTRLYEMALHALGVTVERIVIIGITDEGEFFPVECEASRDDAIALLDTFRSRKRINAGMAAQRREAKKAAAAA